ncbi:MAG: FliA/WhiG family RNA polymerase sigma factor, partial [Candidatus Hydrogenedentes bacterium]|nr:FliA/WhiG family RNA polymerase sigma factor [Candidatus Hydrogenedentota bacterium]
MADEKALWSRWKERGDLEAREALIVRHMKIVKYVAGRMAIHVPSSIDMDDLVGWGVLGLMDAVEKYDHTQDIKFTTYASIRVRGAILDQIRSLDWAPRSLRAMARKVANARDQLRQEQGREPTNESIAERLGTTEDQIDDTVYQLQTAQILSLQDYIPSGDDGESRKLDVTVDERAVNPNTGLLEKEKQDQIADAILQLPDQQQKVLNLYYFEELTL